MKLKLDRIISLATLLTSVVAIVLVVKRPAPVAQPPADQPYGDRSAGVIDPFGNQWFIATHIKDVAF